MGNSIWYFDDANLVIVLVYGFKGDGVAIGRPAGSSRYGVEGSQLRAIGSIAVAHPDIAIAHAVRLEDDLLAIGRIAGPRNESPTGEESQGSSQCMALVLEVEPPNGVRPLP
jgi:hypothetical protein